MDKGTIKIHSSFFFLQWVFYIFKPIITIDGGAPDKPGWGDSSYPVDAGQHTVNIEIPYIFMKIAKATDTVSVAAGETVTLNYKPPFIVFMKGKLTRADA